MDLDQAIELLKKAVKNNATNDQKHIDLTVVPSEQRLRYQEALKVSQMAIRQGTISKDDFNRRVHLE
jgi:hypothetical protein